MTESRARRNGVALYMASMQLVLSMTCEKRRKRRDRVAQPERLLQAMMCCVMGWTSAAPKGPGRDSVMALCEA